MAAKTEDGVGDATASYMDNLHTVIEGVTDPGTFATGKKVDMPLPGLHIENIGRVGLPLCVEQANKLKECGEQAPFGKGADTVVDTSVRLAWQVDGSLVKCSDKWSERVQELVTEAVVTMKPMAVPGSTRANLYKLVMYEAGGFFKRHKDTEKVPGMFGTLVVQLPCGHEGGTLVVWHKSTRMDFTFAKDSEDCFFATAFFADCEHELLPVTSGTRLCLLYNLVHTGSGTQPVLTDYGNSVQQVEKAVREWECDCNAPEKLAVKLEHEYTKTNLSFQNLKGHDLAVAQMLQQCKCKKSGAPLLDIHLALVTKHEVGSTEDYYDTYRYKRGRYYDYDYAEDKCTHHTMDEIYETSVYTENWVALDGSNPSFSNLNIDIDSEVLGNSEVFSKEPSDEDYEGYTGNAGPSLDYWYYTAVLVIWPLSKSIVLRCSSNFAAGVDMVFQLLKSNERNARTTALDTLWQVVDYALNHKWLVLGNGYRLLEAARCLRSREMADAALHLMSHIFAHKKSQYSSEEVLIAEGIHSTNSALITLATIKRFGWATVSDKVLRIVKNCPLTKLAHCAELCVSLHHESNNNEAAALVAQACTQRLLDADALFSEIFPPNAGNITSIIQMLIQCPCGDTLFETFTERAAAIPTQQLFPPLLHVSKHASMNVCEEPFASRFIALLLVLSPVVFQTELSSNVLGTLLEFGNYNPNLVQGFVTKCLNAPSNKQLLHALTHNSTIRHLGSNSKPVQELVKARIKQVTYAKPEFSWCQKFANVSGHPKVTEFLRSSQQCMSYSSDFRNIICARKFISKYLSHALNLTNQYSATGTPGGQGRNSYVEITKTRKFFEWQLQQYDVDQKERQELLHYLQKCGANFAEQIEPQPQPLQDSNASNVIDLTE